MIPENRFSAYYIFLNILLYDYKFISGVRRKGRGARGTTK